MLKAFRFKFLFKCRPGPFQRHYKLIPGLTYFLNYRQTSKTIRIKLNRIKSVKILSLSQD